MDNLNLDSLSENAFSQMQDTALSPMEEALFKSWATANQIEKPDKPGDNMDYRGVYKNTGGKILPPGQLKQLADTTNNQQTLMRVLQDRMKDHAANIADKVSDQADKQIEKTEDMKREAIKAKLNEPTPRQLRSVELENKGIELDTGRQEVKNEGKKIDVTKLVVQHKTGANKPKGKSDAK